MDRIVPDYVVGFVYGALVESYSCEQNARMMAMEVQPNSAKICSMSWILNITVPDRQQLPGNYRGNCRSESRRNEKRKSGNNDKEAFLDENRKNYTGSWTCSRC